MREELGTKYFQKKVAACLNEIIPSIENMRRECERLDLKVQKLKKLTGGVTAGEVAETATNKLRGSFLDSLAISLAKEYKGIYDKFALEEIKYILSKKDLEEETELLKDLEKFTLMLENLQKKIYIRLFREHYSNNIITSFTNGCSLRLSSIFQLHAILNQNQVSFWNGHRDSNVAQNSRPLVSINTDKMIELFREMNNFNEMFKKKNQDFLNKINGNPYYLNLTLTDEDKKQFTDLCKLQQNYELEIRELENNEKVQAILKNKNTSGGKNYINPNDNPNNGLLI